MEEKELLILKYDWLIKKIAQRFYNCSFEELYQEGVIGLIKAFENYKINTTAKFSTYAYDYIFGQMYALAESAKTIKVNKETLRLCKEISRVRESLFQINGMEPTISELAHFLELPEEVVVDAINSAVAIISLDDTYLDSDTTYYETIKDSKELHTDESIILKEEIGKLPSPQKEIMINRYYKDMTQSETATDLGITQVMVSRLESKSLALLKSNVNYI